MIIGLLINMFRVDTKVRVLQLSNNLQHGTLRGSLTLRTNYCENEVSSKVRSDLRSNKHCDFRRNSQTIRTISRSVASDSTRDLDFVSAVFLVDASRNDKIDLFLADFSGNGVTDIMFCGFFVGS